MKTNQCCHHSCLWAKWALTDWPVISGSRDLAGLSQYCTKCVLQKTRPFDFFGLVSGVGRFSLGWWARSCLRISLLCTGAQRQPQVIQHLCSNETLFTKQVTYHRPFSFANAWPRGFLRRSLGILYTRFLIFYYNKVLYNYMMNIYYIIYYNSSKTITYLPNQCTWIWSPGICFFIILLGDSFIL